MGLRRNKNNVLPFLRLLSLLVATDAAGGGSGVDVDRSRERRLRRRRLGGGLREEEPIDVDVDVEEEEDARKRASSFYDLSSMTKEEKLNLVQKAYSLHRHGDSIDWDLQRAKYVEAVRESRSRGGGGGGGGSDMAAAMNDDAYDGETDDTLPHDDDESLAAIAAAVDGNDDAYDGGVDDTIDNADSAAATAKRKNGGSSTANGRRTRGNNAADDPRAPSSTSSRRLQRNNIDGDVFDGYEYSRGACPDAGSLGVPCAPNNLSALCNKYNDRRGSFRECMTACTPAYCCIHDANPEGNQITPNCKADENCAQYNYCYIAWWKLSDTIGPASRLRVEQDDEFFDVPAEDIQADSTGSELFTQVLLHHFDDINQVIEDGTVGTEFNSDNIFLDPDYWEYPVTDKLEISEIN